MDANIPIHSATKNETTTLQAMIIEDLKETDGKQFFSGIEPTKHSQDEGHYILVTQKTCLDEAEKAFNKMIKTLEYHNKKIYISNRNKGLPHQPRCFQTSHCIHQIPCSQTCSNGQHLSTN
jgi:hypothetical protein